MEILETLGKLLTRMFSTSSERYVKRRGDFLDSINTLEPELAQLTDEQLRAKTDEFRTYIRQQQQRIIGADLRQRLGEISRLPEEARRPAKKRLTEQLQASCEGIVEQAFAVVRETSDRHLGIRNVFDDNLEFNPAFLSTEMRTLYQDVKKQIEDGSDIHAISLPCQFYDEVRHRYPAHERPPFRFRHFDVQMIGGSVLYEGSIAEMATGEGKTLAATLATYLVALTGRHVHVITVNDYLAKRDRDWMGPVYEALGLTVGAIQSDMDTAGDERRQQYACDITYGTNNEFGFDYLRDNMKSRFADQVQGPLDYTIVDEVDSILIDEARTPLIISGPAFDDTARYKQADKIALELIRLQSKYRNIEKQIDQSKRLIAQKDADISDAKKNKDSNRLKKTENQLTQTKKTLEDLEGQLERTTQFYEVEYDRRSVHLTHEGIGAAQDMAGVGSFYVGSNMEWPHLMEQALRAHVVFEREKDYVVQQGEVIIVDEFTGRLMQGRQWSDGLHQAVEAKEQVHVKEESQTLATITIQNFFKLYQQLAGMTGTAMTETEEFMKIYQLDVVAIPTNKPIIRDDRDDLIYKTFTEKFSAIVDETHEMSQAGRPVLIGTISIEKSEALSAALNQRYGLEHEVLNAKQHAREATIVTKAGQQHQRRDGSMWGNITIATNMAGRGTDIKLGPAVIKAGGLHVLGTERHEARRIDNQLRGRCGRQGDDGSSQFFLSFEDELLRLFGGDRMLKLMSMFRWPEGEPLVHQRLSKFVEKTQKKVEQRNFESRKSLLEYDEVMDYQRQVFYTRRQSILEGVGLEGLIWEMIGDVIAEHTQKMLHPDYPYQCALEWARTALGIDVELDRIRGNEREDMEALLRDHAKNNADQDINITLGEYMGEDLDPKDWDLRGLSKWAMSRFNVNISQNHLRKMSPGDVQETLADAAAERIDKLDMSPLGALLETDYPLKSLTDYVNQKFALEVDPNALEGLAAENIEEHLLQAARDAYRRREVEYPVDFILHQALRGQQSGSGFAARDIVEWARRKYHAELSIDDVQNLSYDKLRRTLLDLSEAYNNGQLTSEIQQTLQEEPSAEALAQWANERFNVTLKPDQLQDEDDDSAADLIERQAREFLRSELTELERYVLLQIYDATWKDHLYAMDHLKSGIGLRGFAERDPKLEYKREGFRMFQEMLSNIRDKVTDVIFKARLDADERMRSVWNISATSHADYERFQAQQEAAASGQGQQMVKTIKLEKPKVGRNEPCPCGSGKKYKKCCGQAH